VDKSYEIEDDGKIWGKILGTYCGWKEPCTTLDG
jgi:hypothetical protein